MIGFFGISHFQSTAQSQKIADSLFHIYQGRDLEINTKLELLRNLSFNESDIQLALSYAEELIRLAKEEKSAIYEYRGYLQKGNKSLRLGLFENALESFQEASRAAIRADYFAGEGGAYSAIASLYVSSNNHENAIQYFGKAIHILRETDDAVTLATTLLNAGDAYMMLESYDSALTYFERSATIFDEINHQTGRAYNLGNTGMVYANLGDNDLAEANIYRAIDILEQMGDFYPICFYLLSMADIFHKQGDLKEALDYAERSLELAIRYKLKQQISDANFKLSALCEEQGNLMESLKYYKAHIAYRDSVTNLETVQKMADLRTEFEVNQKQHEVDQKESEITLLEKEKELHRTYILIAIFSVLSSYAFVLYLRQRLRTTRIKAAAEQKEHDDRVKDLLKAKETSALQAMVQGKEEERRHLAKELHNHLGSLLATVKINLNGLESRDKAKHQNIIGLVDQATQDVRNISHELNMGVSDGFGLIPALEELVSHLRQANDLEILLSVDLELVKIDSQNEILLYRIVQELISNVLKHANATALSIFLTGFEGGNLINILVEDNGRGFDPNHLGREDKGMGLNSLQEIILKLDGELNIDSNPESGTAISIDLALPIPENTLES